MESLNSLPPSPPLRCLTGRACVPALAVVSCSLCVQRTCLSCLDFSDILALCEHVPRGRSCTSVVTFCMCWWFCLMTVPNVLWWWGGKCSRASLVSFCFWFPSVRFLKTLYLLGLIWLIWRVHNNSFTEELKLPFRRRQCLQGRPGSFTPLTSHDLMLSVPMQWLLEGSLIKWQLGTVSTSR